MHLLTLKISTLSFINPLVIVVLKLYVVSSTSACKSAEFVPPLDTIKGNLEE